MAAVRHLEIVLPPCKTTHEVSLAGRSCLSNFMSIWYTDLKIQLFEFFVYLAWTAYSGPKTEGFVGLWTPKCDYSSSRPPKGTFLRKSASVKLSTVKILWGVWPVGELTESVTDTQTQTQTHTHTHTGKFIFCPCIALDRQECKNISRHTVTLLESLKWHGKMHLSAADLSYDKYMYAMPQLHGTKRSNATTDQGQSLFQLTDL